MSRDNAPIKNTCPIIDDVVRYIEGFRHDFSNDENQNDFKDALSILEDIRSANSELRNWGNEEYNRANEAERERDKYDTIIKTLQSDVEYYERQIRTLEADTQ